jgi:hypothetical protein
MSGNKNAGTRHRSDTAVTGHDSSSQRVKRNHVADVESGETAVSNAMRVSPLHGTYTACF